MPVVDEDMGVGDAATADSEGKPAGRGAPTAAAPAGRAAPAASTRRAAPSTEAADDADTEEDTTLPLAGAKKRRS